jgi:ribonucleoside-diphosphate reductase alpha chain
MNKEEDEAAKILSDTTVNQKYAKWIATENRRETWEEICLRNMEMHLDTFKDMPKEFLDEIEQVYTQYVLPKKVLPSMRSMQFAGKPVEISPNRMYNCAYMPIDDIECFNEAMFLLLGGTGVGYSVQHHHIKHLPPVSKPSLKTRKYVLEDSIQGWAESVRILMECYTGGRKNTPRFDYSQIRPKGSILKTSGGKAPGPAPLRECLVKIEGMFQNMENDHQLTSLECHDMLCHIADAVLSGGIRRSALIALFSADDNKMIGCKSGQWYNDNPQRGRANNSALILRHRIKRPVFGEIWKRIKMSGSGEPGIYFSHDKDWGTNPCCEIALRPYQFCNLTEINANSINNQKQLENRAVAAAFLGTLQAAYTDFHYLRPVWQTTTEKEALLGVSMTGIASNNCNQLDIEHAAGLAVAENQRISQILGINSAARVTCVKPSGTTSCVVGSSSGIHAWFAPYYIRRMTINKNEAIYSYLKEKIPELVEDDFFKPDEEAKIMIPQKAPVGATVAKHESALGFLERVKRWSIRWVRPGHIDGLNSHNVSATVYIKDDEWDAVGEWMWMNRHYYNGLAVLPFDGGSYTQAPFEEIDKPEYDRLFSYAKLIDLTQVIETEDNTNLQGEIACAGGVCEI